MSIGKTPAPTRFAQGGGVRVLFACGQDACVGASKAAAAKLERAGISARVVSARGEGHSYSGHVALAIEGAFDWLTDGDARWQRVAPLP